MKALLVYSGGMDSTVLLNQFQKQVKACLNFNYGSKHNEEEAKYALKNCAELDIPLYRQELDFRHFKSDLLKSGGDIPKGHYEDESMKKTVVPFRNGIMLSFATGIAESLGLNTILIANHFGDHAIYPDCREIFINPMGTAIYMGTDKKVRLVAPYSQIDKRAIAIAGKKLKVDFAQTYSCYEGGEVHCGECGTCTERKEALKGFDTTDYLK